MHAFVQAIDFGAVRQVELLHGVINGFVLLFFECRQRVDHVAVQADVFVGHGEFGEDVFGNVDELDVDVAQGFKRLGAFGRRGDVLLEFLQCLDGHFGHFDVVAAHLAVEINPEVIEVVQAVLFFTRIADARHGGVKAEGVVHERRAFVRLGARLFEHVGEEVRRTAGSEAVGEGLELRGDVKRLRVLLQQAAVKFLQLVHPCFQRFVGGVGRARLIEFFEKVEEAFARLRKKRAVAVGGGGGGTGGQVLPFAEKVFPLRRKARHGLSVKKLALSLKPCVPVLLLRLEPVLLGGLFGCHADMPRKRFE